MTLKTFAPLWLCVVLMGTAIAEDPTIAVVIEAKKPSRPAHFNWHFTSASGKEPQVGRFACGSYWVAPAVDEASVVFVSLTGSPDWTDLLSCDDDPLTERHGLLNGNKRYGSHDPTENLLPKLPITYTPKADSCVSLVAAMQRDEDATSKGGTRQIVGEVVDAYCVVTILPQAPQDGGTTMIRPNITGATKEFLTWEDFDLDRLPRYDFMEGKSEAGWLGTAHRWSHTIEIFGLMTERKPGVFGKFSEGGRAFRSHLLVPDYAAGTARSFNGDLLALFSAAGTLEEKKPGLAAMLAYGLDIYHARFNSGDAARKSWSSGAGQSLGTFLPPVLAAALLRDESKAHRLRQVAITNHGKDRSELGPQELRQITRGVTGVLLWGDNHPFNRSGKNNLLDGDWRYWADMKASSCYDSALVRGSPSEGKKTAADPYGFIDGPANRPGSSYMSVSFGGFRAFAAAMILMPEIRSVVNTDAPIEYVDRVTRHGLWTWPDPVAAPTPEDQSGTCTTWWKAKGCSHWQTKWGPQPEDIRFAIEDGVGRFRSMHGKAMGTGYETHHAEAHWPTIIALYEGQTYEDYAVDLGVVVTPEIRFATGAQPQAYLFCATPDAVIHYTLDGSEPTSASPTFTGEPVPVTAATEVKAVAVHDSKTTSRVSSGRVPRPLADLN